MNTLIEFLEQLTKKETRNPHWIMTNADRLLKEQQQKEFCPKCGSNQMKIIKECPLYNSVFS